MKGSKVHQVKVAIRFADEVVSVYYLGEVFGLGIVQLIVMKGGRVFN